MKHEQSYRWAYFLTNENKLEALYRVVKFGGVTKVW